MWLNVQNCLRENHNHFSALVGRSRQMYFVSWNIDCAFQMIFRMVNPNMYIRMSYNLDYSGS